MCKLDRSRHSNDPCPLLQLLGRDGEEPYRSESRLRKSKIWNSLKQVTRLGFLRMREVRKADEEAAQIASEEQDRAETAADATRAAARGKSAVMRNFGRGVDDKAKALQGMSPKAIARMCHCIREHMARFVQQHVIVFVEV